MTATTPPAALRRPAGTLGPFELTLYGLTVVCWSTSWFAITLQIGPVPAEISVFWRFVLAAAIMAGWAVVGRHRLSFPPSDHLRFAAQGLTLFSTNFVLFYHGAALLPSGLLSVVFSLASIVNLLLAAFLFGQRITRRVLGGALLGFLGVGLMFLPQIAGAEFDHGALLGLGLCVAGTLCFCTGNMISAAMQRRQVAVAPATAWGMAYGAAFLGLYGLARGLPFAIETTPAYLGGLLYLAVGASVIAFAAYLTLLGRIGAGRAGYATVMFPVFALAISTALEGYHWTLPAVAGVILALSGNLLVLRRP